jgi:hypothetical protein
MKKSILVVALLLAACSSTTAQKPAEEPKPVKTVQVTAETIAKQPTGQTYVLDLTNTGVIYSVDANVDYNRVRVRTTKGEMTITEALRKSGKPISGPFRIGTKSDMRTQKLGITRAGGGTSNYYCDSVICTCTDDVDCNNMFTFGWCGNVAVCYPDGCFCLVLL